MSTARKRFQLVSTTEARLRENQMDDLRFRASEQWPMTVKSDRELDDRPYLTINRLPQFIRQVVNAQRQARPSIKVNPVENSDIDTAAVFQGIIRHIENQSDANVAYITAAEQQVTFGRGYWRLVTEYMGPDTFQQEIWIRRVPNAFSVYMDPAMDLVTQGHEPRFAFVVEDVPKDEYIARYGSESMSSLVEFMSTGDRSPDWMPEGKIRIAEYWYVEYEKSTLLHVKFADNGQEMSVSEKDYQKFPKTERDAAQVLRRREVLTPQVYWCKINGAGIIDGNDDKTAGRKWPGKYIPIVPVIGDEINLNGDIDYRGMVRDAKDTQRLYNYQNTALAETLALAPKAPFIGYFGQFENQEKKWNQANRRNFPYLEVNPITLSGTLAPLPQRNAVESPIGAIVEAIHQADNDLKSLMGLYEPSLGARSPNTLSGVAIQALQQQGTQANSNFMDNLNRSIKVTGRILVDLIPHIYDAPRVLRIIGPDEQPKTVMVHANAPEAQLPQADAMPAGVEGIYDLSRGKFDVVCSSGPDNETKRKENLAGLLSIVQAYPESFQFLGDLIVGDMDWPQAQAAAIRLKKTLPPQLQDGDHPIPPEVQAKMAQMEQQAQMMGMQLQETQKQLEQAMIAVKNKQAEIQADLEIKRMDLESQERREARRTSVDLQKEHDRLQASRDIEILKSQLEERMARIQAALDAMASERALATERATTERELAHDAESEAAARAHERQQAVEDRAHEHATTVAEQAHEEELASEAAAAKEKLARAKPKPSPKKEKE